MAKLTVQVQLKKDDGSLLGSSISSEKPTKSEALAVIASVIQARVDAAQQGAADMVDAQNAFNS